MNEDFHVDRSASDANEGYKDCDGDHQRVNDTQIIDQRDRQWLRSMPTESRHYLHRGHMATSTQRSHLDLYTEVKPQPLQAYITCVLLNFSCNSMSANQNY